MTHKPQRQTQIGALFAVVAAAAANGSSPGPSAASSARTAPAVEELSEPNAHLYYAPKEQQ